MKKITVVLNTPILDRIPSLCTLIEYLGAQGYDVKIISPTAKGEHTKTFNSKNIRHIQVKQRSKKIELPTFIKILFTLLKNILFNRSEIYIGGDYVANRIISLVKPIFQFRYIDFVLEYPNIDIKEEVNVLKSADYLITHDKWHADFLEKNCGVSKDIMCYLPNATSSEQVYETSTFLHDRLDISTKNNIILHSGGLQPGFLCKELAMSTVNWPDNNILVFHTSTNVETSEYYKEIKTGSTDKVVFSTNPVKSSELDTLNASAHIGVALYTLKNRSYKALYMGLASGKIGNYLKCGLPVIATRLPSLSYLEEYECGILVDDFESISVAIDTINKSYDVYRSNAHICYEKLWKPDRYLLEIENKIIK